MHSDIKKRSLALLFAAGDVKRYVFRSINSGTDRAGKIRDTYNSWHIKYTFP